MSGSRPESPIDRHDSSDDDAVLVEHPGKRRDDEIAQLSEQNRLIAELRQKNAALERALDEKQEALDAVHEKNVDLFNHYLALKENEAEEFLKRREAEQTLSQYKRDLTEFARQHNMVQSGSKLLNVTHEAKAEQSTKKLAVHIDADETNNFESMLENLGSGLLELVLDPVQFHEQMPEQVEAANENQSVTETELAPADENQSAEPDLDPAVNFHWTEDSYQSVFFKPADSPKARLAKSNSQSDLQQTRQELPQTRARSLSSFYMLI